MPLEGKLRAVKLIGSANAELLAKLVVKVLSITTGLVHLLVGWSQIRAAIFTYTAVL